MFTHTHTHTHTGKLEEHSGKSTGDRKAADMWAPSCSFVAGPDGRFSWP